MSGSAPVVRSCRYFGVAALVAVVVAGTAGALVVMTSGATFVVATAGICVFKFVLGFSVWNALCGFAGVATGAVVAGREFASALRTSDSPARCACEFRIPRTSDSPRNVAEVYFVILVSALPDPAPKSASVVPPPKARPAPASFFGN